MNIFKDDLPLLAWSVLSAAADAAIMSGLHVDAVHDSVLD